MNALSLNNRANLQVLRTDVESALKAVADKHGLTVSVAGISYAKDGSNAVVKSEFAAKSTDGVVLNRAANDFKTYAHLYGFKPEHLNADFVRGGKKYKITGMAPNATRCPILADRLDDGKTYKFPAETVRNAMGIDVFNQGTLRRVSLEDALSR